MHIGAFRRPAVSRITVVLVAAVAVCALLASRAAAEVSDRQREQLKSLAADTRQKTERARAELRNARAELYSAYQVYELDERRAKAAIERINSAQLQLLKIHLENQLEIRQVLDSSQFREMMSRAHNPRGMAWPSIDDSIADRIPDRQMIEDLGLGTEQKRRALALIGPSSERTRLLEKLRRDTRQMMEIYSRYDLDSTAADRIIESIHSSQIELTEQNHKRQQQLREVLTQRQFERLQKAIAERLQSMKKPRPRR